MSQLLQRGLRRQRAIQQSRSAALALLVIASIVLFIAAVSWLASVAGGGLLSLRAMGSLLVALTMLWICGHLFREARRLGKLLQDPERIMRSDQDPDLVSGVHWSVLNPFSGWRD